MGWYGAVVAVARVGEVTVIDLGGGDNRLSPDVLSEFHGVLDELEAGSGPRALVTRATGKIWSNGLDLDHMAAEPDDFWTYLAEVERLLARVLVLGVPTVAAVTGHAFGAGAMLSLCHDTTVMRSDRGYWCLPEIDLGMELSAGEHTLVQAKLPPATVNLALTTGHRFDAAAAVAAGIAQESCSDEELAGRAVEIAAARAAKATPTLAGLKLGMYGSVAERIRDDITEALEQHAARRG